MSRYEETVNGMRGAVEYEKGNIRAESHKYSVSEPEEFSAEEIKKIRNELGMTQVVFAACFGVAKKTVEGWEGGRSRPDGASRRLLSMLKSNPRLFHENGVLTQSGKLYKRPETDNSLKAAQPRAEYKK